MMPETEKQEVHQFAKDGEKLARAQVIADALAKKLTSGNIWSAEGYEEVMEKYLLEIKKITH